MSDDGEGVAARQPAAGTLDQLTEPLAFEQLHRIERRVALVVDVVDVDYVWMRESLGVMKFAPERVDTAGPRRMRLHDLDGDAAVRDAQARAIQIPGLVYRGHAPAAQQL